MTGPRERAPLAREAMIRLSDDINTPNSRIKHEAFGKQVKLLIPVTKFVVNGFWCEEGRPGGPPHWRGGHKRNRENEESVELSEGKGFIVRFLGLEIGRAHV